MFFFQLAQILPEERVFCRAAPLGTPCLKVSSSQRKIFFSVHGMCPNFSMRLCLRTRGKLRLANFRLKIREVRDKIPPESLSSARTFTVIATGYETSL